MYKLHPDFKPFVPVTFEQLQDIMDRPVVDVSLLKTPVVIRRFRIVNRGADWFLEVFGTQGEYGMAPCSERCSYLRLILERFARYAVGRDARELEDILHTIYVSDINYKIQGLGYWCVIAWIEAAVLDMLGRCAGFNVTSLLGGRRRDRIEIYVASGNRGTTPEEEVDILQKRVNETGAKAVKFKLGGRMSRNADSIEGRSEGLLYLARKHFGDDFVIHCDGNGSYDTQNGIEMGRLAEDVNAYFYEEPCPFDDLWATKEVADALDIPLAFGEQETSLRRFAWLVENNACQVLQPDLQYTGGFIQCIKAARMAAAAGIPVTPHVSKGFASYNTLLYNSVIENCGHYHEYKGFKTATDYTLTAFDVQDGFLTVPEGPGLGFDFSGLFREEGCRIVSVIE
ncbi:MAG: mandelate racemase/muconate lactonizing enzyme family protein [Lachnospiraceae bacterium]|nr:mandelate racemase/muconate lactonizing enzyme family protein [Lachnospiraceae bacterium]